MTTAQPPITLHQPLWAFRGALVGASVLGLAFAVAALIGYPAPPDQVALY